MKQILRPFFILLMMAALTIAGCSNSAEQGADAEKPGEKKNLGMQDVLSEADKALKEGKGLSYAITGNQTMTMDLNGQKEELEQTFDIDMDMTTDPLAMHMKGSMKMMGQEMPMEIYMVDNMMYQKTETGGWTKGQLDGLDMAQMGGQTQTPNQALEQLRQFVDKLRGDKQDENLKMSKEDGAYVIEVTVTKDVDAEFLGQMEDALRSAMVPQLEQSLPISKDDINVKVDKYVQKVWIDENNFQQKKVEQTMNAKMDIKDIKVDIVQDMKMDLKGNFEGTITVPEEAK
ncbi:hypothetical protein CLV97_13042 [Planifilum fimeticola]|uniref:Lipoprotein n=1 Tax=Planifilum fimeticola TaxID=201975 RepID=A0A2T0LB46_9BACL|nr:DUF6612 family protein [Planifilum fimeticola]PRX39102.1 hypothetical protein CLV97_13042 [Planifilum fimeticola]